MSQIHNIAPSFLFWTNFVPGFIATQDGVQLYIPK